MAVIGQRTRNLGHVPETSFAEERGEMGLTLHYQLRLPASLSSESVDDVLRELRDAAVARGFGEVSWVQSMRSESDRGGKWGQLLEFWAEVIAEPFEEEVSPVRGDQATASAFFVNPGRECETAAFGFLRRIDDEGVHGEWYWDYHCKT